MNKNDLIKTENIIKLSPSDTLSVAVGKLGSSHDAAFVFTDEGKYIGVINPYYTLIKTTYPGTTKVENCVFHPPRVNINDSMERIAQLMTESKIHYLPVLDDNQKFIGITSARRLLKKIQQMDISKTNILNVSENRSGGVVSVYQDDSIEQAMQLFKEHKISKLIVIDKNMKLQGIVSYNELTPYLAAPGQGEKEKKMLGKNDKNHLMKMKVKNYSIKTVLTMKPTQTVAQAIDEMMSHSMGSVVIVDEESHPIGIVTTKDILNLLNPKKIKKSIDVTKKNISSANEPIIQDLASYVSRHVEQNKDIRSSHIIAEEERNGSLFRISVHLVPEKGDVTVFEKESKDLTGIVKGLKKLLRVDRT